MTERTRESPSAAAGRWLVCVAALPTDDPNARMRVLRTLESLGATLLREGAYLLPDTPPNRFSLETLVEYVVKSAGVAHLLQVEAAPAQHEAFVALFDRSARYDELIKTVESLRVGFGHSEPAAIARVLHKQRREFEAIAALDFFPSIARSRAERALAEAEAAVRKLQFASQSPHAALGPDATLLRRTWATRKPLWADRLACAWLIRRFVDPEAKMLWLEKAQPAPAEAVGFGFDGAHFAGSEGRIAYEEMLTRFSLAGNPALARIGAIVQFLEGRGAPVPEAAGVHTLLQGASRRASGETELMAEAEKTFDLLYEAYYEPAKRQPDG